MDAFEDYLDNLSLDSILINLFKIPNFLNFLILDSTNYNVPLTFSSKFSLITNESDAINNYNTSRLTICLNKRNETCNFLNASKYDFIPYDFKFNNYANRTIYILMDKLQIIMSLIYTFDMSVISNENILEITMFGSGFKTFSIDFKNADFSKLNNIYEIFDWSYCNETTDKILITKNILGSYFISKNDLYISNDLITTIKSNHKIYLKENIDKYIDIKKSIVDSLLKVETDLLDLLNQFTDSFIKNLGMILTFIFSLILLNSFSDKRFSNIFTKDVTLISLGIVAISCAYLWITIKDITFKKDILDLTKSKIQKNYYSILSENEVNEILELEESDSKDIVINFKKKIKIYEIFWIITIVVFFIIIFVLGFQHFKWCFYYLYNFIKSLL